MATPLLHVSGVVNYGSFEDIHRHDIYRKNLKLCRFEMPTPMITMMQYILDDVQELAGIDSPT